jgi:hypothetical protein
MVIGIPEIGDIFYRLEKEGLIVYEVESKSERDNGTRVVFKIIKILGKESAYVQVNNRDSYLLKKGEPLKPFLTSRELVKELF